MRKLNIVFMGSPDFAVPSLRKLADSGHSINLVVTGPDKRRGRRQKPTPTPVKAEAEKAGLPVFETDDVSGPDFQKKMEDIAPDLMVVVAFKILPESILQIPGEGAINLHASLLPKYRGAAPIHHAVMNGETETGCTVFFLNKGIDTGNIIEQRKTPVGVDETTGDVYERLMELGSELLRDCVDSIAAGTAEAKPQPDAPATRAPKLYKERCQIDFDQPAEQVHNFIRGLSPFPAAWTHLDGKHVNIYRTRIVENPGLKPGEIQSDNGSAIAGCKSGAVELVELQMEGKKRMSGDELLRGLHKQSGWFEGT